MSIFRVTQAQTALLATEVEAESEADAIQKAQATASSLVASSSLWSAVRIGDTPPSSLVPQGFSTYFRNPTDNMEDAVKAAKLCQAAAMPWVALMVEGNNGYQVPLARNRKYADEMKKLGIQVAVWSFPGDERASTVAASEDAALLLTMTARELGAMCVIADVELPYKKRSTELAAFLDTIKATKDATMSFGVVSYPIPSFHPTLDWETFRVCDWGGPLFYETASDPSLIAKGKSEWSQLTPVLIPSLSAFGDSGVVGAERLKGDISRVCGTPAATVPAAMLWSYPQTDDAKRAVTRDMATQYGWPK